MIRYTDLFVNAMVSAGLGITKRVLEKVNFFGDEEKKPMNQVQNQLLLPHTGITVTNDTTQTKTGAIPMAMSTATPGTHVGSGIYSRPDNVTRSNRASRRAALAASTTATTWVKRDYRIVRHYLGPAAYPQRVIEDLMTEGECREHCISPEACSMTCTSKAGKRRTRRLGHWFDTFEKYR